MTTIEILNAMNTEQQPLHWTKAEQNNAINEAEEALEKQTPYKLKQTDGDTGICKCGVVTEIIDEPFYCKYCGQRLCKQN